MKKHISLLLALAALLTLCPAVSAFEDVPAFAERAAAESLASLGIVDDVERFNPQNYLTRAQFCKIAVLAAGFDEMSLYKNYTIYPDVPSGAWYAPYVNAAVRKYSIIKGDDKGRFNPNSNITYGEAVTIMLRMLGYTTADIGLMWPNDYVNKAESINLNSAMVRYGARSPITRGQAAILMCNMLLSNTKEGGMYASTGHTTASEPAILLSTSKTNPTLSSNQAVLYHGGENHTYVTSHNISPALCGLRGIPVFEPKSQSRLKGFIADIGGASLETVVKATSDALTVKSGRINIPRDTLTLSGGSIGSYITHWFDIKDGDEISVYYSDKGEIELIAAHSQTSVSLGETVVFGESTVQLQPGAKFIKRGVEISRSDLNEYDVLSYSQANNTYYVSSDKVTLLYQSGSPVYANPSEITAGNRTFRVSESAGKYFGRNGIKLGARMTLLLDYNGALAAVIPVKQLTAKAVGVLTSLSDTACTVELLSGLKLEGTPVTRGFGNTNIGGKRVNGIYKLDGQLVEVAQNNDGDFSLSAVKLSRSASGNIDASAGTVGKRKLAPDAAVYECCAAGMPLHKISLSDIPASAVSGDKILHAGVNSSDQIDVLVLEDVTGDRYIYGMISATSERAETGTDLSGSPIYSTRYNFKIMTSGGLLTYSSAVPSSMSTFNSKYVPAAISADLVGDSARAHSPSTPVFALTEAGKVSRGDFDAYRGVKLGTVFVPVEENVVIYDREHDRFISTLSEARANFETFTVYMDRPAIEGGSVRVLIAE